MLLRTDRSVRFSRCTRLETIRDRVDDARDKYENEVSIGRRKVELLQQENHELKSRFLDEK